MTEPGTIYKEKYGTTNAIKNVKTKIIFKQLIIDNDDDEKKN
jgi:hypothetical protein